jgi:hypothetical protein
MFFLATIFSEPEGFFSVYIPALTGRRFGLVCSGKEFRKHSARRCPAARRPRVPFLAKWTVSKGVTGNPRCPLRYIFCEIKKIPRYGIPAGLL